MADKDKGWKQVNSDISKLDPYIDDKNILRVGGRLRKGDMATDAKFPIIIPKGSKIARLIVEWCDRMVKHAGRMLTLNEVRTRGYWVIN